MKKKTRSGKQVRVCDRPYHDDTHPELCVFEDTLDIYLEPNAKLSEDAQRLREKLIDGVMLMRAKVSGFRVDELERKERGKWIVKPKSDELISTGMLMVPTESSGSPEPYQSMPRSTTMFCPTTGKAYIVNEKLGLHFCPLHGYNETPVVNHHRLKSVV